MAKPSEFAKQQIASLRKQISELQARIVDIQRSNEKPRTHNLKLQDLDGNQLQIVHHGTWFAVEQTGKSEYVALTPADAYSLAEFLLRRIGPKSYCSGVIPGTLIACGEGGNYCSQTCMDELGQVELK